jgi:hypothetical protein
MASLSTLVAGLAGSIERSTVRSCTVPGDVAELAASIALHSLGLAVPSKMVRAATLIAGCRSRATSETSAAAEASVSTTRNRSATTHADTGRVGAGSSQVTGLAAVIAATVTTGTA